MNCCFYPAIDRLPLATVAAIEFLPVIALAALGARTRRNLAALALAVPGVYLLTGVQLGGEPLGVALRVRQRRRCSRSTSCSPTASPSDPALERHRRARRRDARRRRRRHADGRLGGGRRRSATRSRSLAGIGVGVSLVGDPLRRRPARAGAPGARDLRADGLAAAGVRDRHRHRRADADPVGAPRSPASPRRRAASRLHRERSDRI